MTEGSKAAVEKVGSTFGLCFEAETFELSCGFATPASTTLSRVDAAMASASTRTGVRMSPLSIEPLAAETSGRCGGSGDLRDRPALFTIAWLTEKLNVPLRVRAAL